MGEPDEFDYVAQLDALSLNDHVQYMRTPDPVFLQVKLCSQELRETWKDLKVIRKNFARKPETLSKSL